MKLVLCIDLESLQTGWGPDEGYCINIDMVRMKENDSSVSKHTCLKMEEPWEKLLASNLILRENG